MESVQILGTELMYEVQGTGEPVLLLHTAFLRDSFRTLLNQPALRGRYQFIMYHRRGYGASRPASTPFGIDEQAQDALALLDYLGIARAHVVGHSFGANIAVQIALSAPERVTCLVLAEPALVFLMSADVVQALMTAVGQAMAIYAGGDKAGAVDSYMTAALGSQWKASLERFSPTAEADAITDADAAFAIEMAALGTWAVGPEQLQQIGVPTLSIAHSDPVDPFWQGFQQVHEGIVRLIPQTESTMVPRSSHLLSVENPQVVAEALDVFFRQQTVTQR